MGDYDVVIIGGGVVGCAVAWRLSFTEARVALVEAAHDVAEGASKGNTGIATCGAETPLGTLETELVRVSADGWEGLCATLDTPFSRIGSLAVALRDDEVGRLDTLAAHARTNGVTAVVVSADQARSLEPLITPHAKAALHVPADGIIDPFRLTIGYAELAARNGVSVVRKARVTAFGHGEHGIDTIETTRGRLTTRFVVAAGGVHGGAISALAGGAVFTTWPRMGQAWLLDRAFGAGMRKVVGGVPTAHTRGVYVAPTTNRSVLVGPTATDHDDPDDRATDAATLDAVLDRARRLVPSISRQQAIKTFAANRPAGDPVYRVERDAAIPNLVHAAAVRSTGVSSSPALAEHVRGLLAEAGAPVTAERPGALRALPMVPRLLDHPDPQALIDADPRYAQVICACEQVTAAEIAQAFAMRVAPTSIDGIRKRTRATGGRCQGAYCMAGVAFLASVYGGARPSAVAVGEPAATLGVGGVS
jgi:glycerol-3-phosphate dehydrogenase